MKYVLASITHYLLSKLQFFSYKLLFSFHYSKIFSIIFMSFLFIQFVVKKLKENYFKMLIRLYLEVKIAILYWNLF